MAKSADSASMGMEFAPYATDGNGWDIDVTAYDGGKLMGIDGTTKVMTGGAHRHDDIEAFRIGCKRTTFDAPAMGADSVVRIATEDCSGATDVPVSHVAKGDVLATPIARPTYTGLTHFRVEAGILVPAKPTDMGARPITPALCMLAGALAMTGYVRSAAGVPKFSFTGDVDTVKGLFLDAANDALGTPFIENGQLHGIPCYSGIGNMANALRASVALEGCDIMQSPLVHVSEECDNWLLAGMMEARNQYATIVRPKKTDSANTRWVTSNRLAFMLLVNLLRVRGIVLGITSSNRKRLKLEINATGTAYKPVADAICVSPNDYLTMLRKAFASACDGMAGNALPIREIDGIAYAMHPVTDVWKFTAREATVLDVPAGGCIVSDAAIVKGKVLIGFKDADDVILGAGDHRSDRSIRADKARNREALAAMDMSATRTDGAKQSIPANHSSDKPATMDTRADGDALHLAMPIGNDDMFDDVIPADGSYVMASRPYTKGTQGGHALTVSADTMIAVPGCFVPAAMLHVGDDVLTGDGSVATVSALSNGIGDAISVTTGCGGTSVIGESTSVVTRMADGVGFANANAVQRGMGIILPWGDAIGHGIHAGKTWHVSDYIGSRQGHERGYANGKAVVLWKPRGGGEFVIPDEVKPSAPLMYLLGALSVGCTVNSGMLRLSISGNSREARADRLCNAIGRVLGGNPGSSTPMGNTIQVRVVSPVVSSMLADMVGIGSDMRHVPDIVMAAAPDVARRAVLGAIDAKGRLARDGKSVDVRIGKEYRHVTGQLKALCMRCGIHAALYEEGGMWVLSFPYDGEHGTVLGVGRTWRYPTAQSTVLTVKKVRNANHVRIVGITLEGDMSKGIVTPAVTVSLM